jgi:hypothetical protein
MQLVNDLGLFLTVQQPQQMLVYLEHQFEEVSAHEERPPLALVTANGSQSPLFVAGWEIANLMPSLESALGKYCSEWGIS